MSIGRVGLLGPVVASTADGIPLRLGPRQQRAAFAVLALNANQFVSIHLLMTAIWGESAPTNAAATLQTYMSRIGRVPGAV
jgi:DNA-binding SARP family transcriptional activator